MTKQRSTSGNLATLAVVVIIGLIGFLYYFLRPHSEWGSLELNRNGQVYFSGSTGTVITDTMDVRILIWWEDSSKEFEKAESQDWFVNEEFWWEGNRHTYVEDGISELGLTTVTVRMFTDYKFLLCRNVSIDNPGIPDQYLVSQTLGFESCSQWHEYEKEVVNAVIACPNDVQVLDEKNMLQWNDVILSFQNEYEDGEHSWEMDKTIPGKGYVGGETYYWSDAIGYSELIWEYENKQLFAYHVAQSSDFITLCFYEGSQKPTATPTITVTPAMLILTPVPEDNEKQIMPYACYYPPYWSIRDNGDFVDIWSIENDLTFQIDVNGGINIIGRGWQYYGELVNTSIVFEDLYIRLDVESKKISVVKDSDMSQTFDIPIDNPHCLYNEQNS